MSDFDRRAVSSLIRRGLAFELGLYRSLFRWVTRRPVVPSPDIEAFGYAKLVTPLMWLWIFASGVEIVVVDLLIPWRTIGIIVLVIGVWGLLWMVGFLASLSVYPHLLSESAIRVRNGSSIDIAVPWDAIATISSQRRDLPSSIRTLQSRETETGTDLQVGVSGQTNVHVVLRHHMTVPTPKGSRQITELSFWADDPRALVTRARNSLTTDEAGREQRHR